MYLTPEKAQALTEKARKLRQWILDMVYNASSGHLGGSLSAVEILTVLYYHHMHIDPQKPDLKSRDRFIASKGHCAPLLYAILADLGYFPTKELSRLREIDSILQGHPDMKKTPGVDMSTGSLGQGLSCGLGLALAGRLSSLNYHVYVLMGDGELNEGQVWEAAFCGAKYKVSNLIAICDRNRLQIDGPTEEVMPLEKLKDKWEAFNWNVLEVDGHNILELDAAIIEAKNFKKGPSIIIAHTIKGKGIDFMENNAPWHGKCPTEEEYQTAKKQMAGDHND